MWRLFPARDSSSRSSLFTLFIAHTTSPLIRLVPNADTHIYDVLIYQSLNSKYPPWATELLAACKNSTEGPDIYSNLPAAGIFQGGQSRFSKQPANSPPSYKILLPQTVLFHCRLLLILSIRFLNRTFSGKCIFCVNKHDSKLPDWIYNREGVLLLCGTKWIFTKIIQVNVGIKQLN